MKRNIVISAIIGILATYLPFWEWTDTLAQATGAGTIAIAAFYILRATEKPQERQLTKGLRKYITRLL